MVLYRSEHAFACKNLEFPWLGFLKKVIISSSLYMSSACKTYKNKKGNDLLLIILYTTYICNNYQIESIFSDSKQMPDGMLNKTSLIIARISWGLSILKWVSFTQLAGFRQLFCTCYRFCLVFAVKSLSSYYLSLEGLAPVLGKTEKHTPFSASHWMQL